MVRFPGIRPLNEMEKRRLGFLIDGALQGIVNTLLAGIFLSGFLLEIGAGEMVIGLLTTCGSWCMLLSVPGTALFKRAKNRQLLLTGLMAFSRLTICACVLLPLVITDRTVLISAVAALVVLGNAAFAIFSMGYSVVTMELLPPNVRNSVVTQRIFASRVTLAVTAVLMGLLLDAFRKSLLGFQIVFGTSFFFAIFNTLTIWKLCAQLEHKEAAERREGAQILTPLKDWSYLKYLIFVFLFFLISYMGVSYTSVYLLKELGLSYGITSFLTFLNYLCLMVFTFPWSRLERRFGMRAVLFSSAILVFLEFLFDPMASHGNFLPVLVGQLASGIGNAGFNISLVNYRYALMPEKGRTAYEAWYMVAFGVAVLGGSVLGGGMMGLTERLFPGVFQNQYQLLFLLVVALGLLMTGLMFLGPKKLRLAKQEEFPH